MLGGIVRKEILSSITSPRFLVLSGLGGLAILLSLFSGYLYHTARVEDYRLAQRATEGSILQRQRSMNWTELSALGFQVHKPPTPMSIFVRGLEPVLGRTVPMAGPIKQLKYSPAATTPILAVFPPLDLGVVVQIVLSLFVLLLTYDAVCGEKEAGTLSLTGSHPVPRDRLLLGKLLGVLLPAGVAFGIPLAFGTGIVLLMPDVDLAGPELWRLAWLMVAFSLYLAAFACAGLFASCLTHRSATSFVLLLGFWVASVAVVPRLSLIAADGLRPTPSMHQHRAQVAEIEREILEEDRALRWKYRDEHPEYWKRTPESQEAYWEFYTNMRKEVQARHQPRIDELEREFNNRYNGRASLATSLARLSPMFALRNVAILLTGTGAERQRRYMKAFEEYNDAYGDWHFDFVGSDLKKAFHADKQELRDWSFSEMPRLAYRDSWPATDVQGALTDIGLLAAWALVFLMGAHVALLKYDLR